MKIPKWEQLDYRIRRGLEKIGYKGFLPTDKNTLRQLVSKLIREEYIEFTLEFLAQIGMFEELGEVVLENRRCCGKISDGIYDRTVFAKIAELYRQAGKLQVAALLFMSVGNVAEVKLCLDKAPKMLKSIQPKSPWDVLEGHGFSEAEAEEIVGCLYFYPYPESIRNILFKIDLGYIKRTPENLWRRNITEGLGLTWITELPMYHTHSAEAVKEIEDKRNYLHNLVVKFSENELVREDLWLPQLLLHTSTGSGMRADHVCFSYGAYELAIQWALGYLQLDLDWFDSVEHGKFAWASEVQENVSLYFEFAGDYNSAISWCEGHKFGHPRNLARLSFMAGDIVEAAKQLERSKSDFGGFYYGNELQVSSMLSGIIKKTEENLCCRTCGAELKKHWKLCPECQTPVDLRCKCGQRIESHWTLWPACGAKLA